MKTIDLSRGKTALVDDEDFERVSRFKWSFHSVGYAFRGIGGGKTRKYQYLHRFILDDPSGIVDHINGNKLDCRRANLRAADKSINSLNRASDANNSSGRRGVSFDGYRNKWVARLNYHGQAHHLGRFDNFEDAVAARVKLETELLGHAVA